MENDKKEEKIELRVRDALDFGWNKTRQRPLFFIAVFFIFAFLPVLISLPFNIMAELRGGSLETMLSSTGAIIHFLIQMFLTAGFITIMLKTLREEGPSLKDFLGKQGYMLRLTGGYLIYSLAVLVGFIFLIVPGIFLAVRFNFFDFFIVDKGMGSIEALKASYAMTEGYWWKIFTLIFVAVPLLFLAAALVVLTLTILLILISAPGLLLISISALFFLFGFPIIVSIVFLAQTFFYAKLVTRREELSQV